MRVEFEISARDYPVITVDHLRGFAAASGDYNPIHLDEKVAKQFGLPGIIAHGMFVASWASDRAYRACRELWPEQTAHIKQSWFRFKEMTLLGDKLTILGTARLPDLQSLEAPKSGPAAGSREDSHSATALLELKCLNQRGELTVLAEFEFQLG